MQLTDKAEAHEAADLVMQWKAQRQAATQVVRAISFLLILALAISLVLLRKKGAPVVAERAGVGLEPPPAGEGREQSIQAVEHEGRSR